MMGNALIKCNPNRAEQGVAYDACERGFVRTNPLRLLLGKERAWFRGAPVNLAVSRLQVIFG